MPELQVSDFLTAHEPVLRLAAFLAIAGVLAGWEALRPRRPLARGRRRRWPVNIAMVALDTVLVRVIFPASVVAGIAAWTAVRHLGLFNAVAAPAGLALAASVVALDLVIYGQHVAMHRVPALWRLHRMHHTDLDVDFTTALRFHPGEIVLSVLVKAAAVVALGAPVAAVIAFEAILNGAAMFNHGNIYLTGTPDRAIRAIVVTPDMHRVHHSVIGAETNSNFGFCLSLWDRLFGTYRERPAAGHEAMVIGLPAFRADTDQGFGRLLANPLAAGKPPA